MTAEEWCAAVDAAVDAGEGKPPSVPVDALVDCLRNGGELAEIPALALLDEIAALRAERDALKARVAELEAEADRLKRVHRFHDDSSVARWKRMVQAVSEREGALVGLLGVYRVERGVEFVAATPGDEVALGAEFVRLLETKP